MSAYPVWGAEKFNLPAHQSATANDSSMAAMTTPSASASDGSLMHPHNPLVAFGILAAVVFGMMAVSTTVRVGKQSASVSIGTT